MNTLDKRKIHPRWHGAGQAEILLHESVWGTTQVVYLITSGPW